MELVAQKRDVFGKKLSALRKGGLLAAELYGRSLDNLHLSVVGKDVVKILKQGADKGVINLKIGQETRPVLLHRIARHPISDEILNIDFYQIRLNEMLKTKVPVEFTGDSPAVKAGGILVKAVQEVEVASLPGAIPRSLVVDLSRLVNIGDSFHVRDLPLAELTEKGVKILFSTC